MAKKFQDIQIGDFLYEIEGSDLNIVKVTEISKKGQKTMMVKVDAHSYAVRVDLETTKMVSSTMFFKWFISKEDALNHLKLKLDIVERTYQRDKTKLEGLLNKLQNEKDI